MDQQDEKETAPSNDAFQYRMGLNDNKAGMEGLDKEKINKIIMDATKVDRMALELERRRDLNRVIVHVDMDAFYAAVEMRGNPELKEKPMAVGSMSMLSTSNYLARRFGVRAAMPGFIAKKLCPNLIIVPLNFDKYREVSKEVREIFAEYDPNFLPLSLDEAYLDITDHLEERLTWPEERRRYVKASIVQKDDSPAGVATSTGMCESEQTQCTSPVLFEDSPSFLNEQTPPQSLPDPAEIADPTENAVVFGTSAEEAVKEMRFRIEQKTSLTASAGIAPNMMLAKVCSDKNKPNGQYVIPHDRQAVMDFIKDLPIRKVPGIGKVTEKMLQALGVTTCTDLYQQRALLSLLFSELSWHNFLHISLGLGSTHIEKDGERKSMSTERTFSEISSVEEQYELCRELCKDLAEDLHKEGLKGRTVTLKLKNVKFEVKTRASTVSHTVCTEGEIFCVAKDILKAEIEAVSPEPLRLRLMGVRVSGFTSEEDKKHQKSITSFLCTNRPANKVCSDATEKAVQERQAPCPQKESFFNQKRAARQQELLESSIGTAGTACTSKDQNVTFPVFEEPKAGADDAKEQPDFTCPICLMKQGDWDLEAFNKHIDECLSKSPSSGFFEMPNKEKTNQINLTANNGGNESDFHANNLKNKMVAITPCDDLYDFVIDKNTLCAIQGGQTLQRNLKGCSSKNMRQDISNMVLGKQAVLKGNDKHIKSTPPGTSAGEGESTLICPVCNTQQATTDLAAFNRHVDICLNKGILDELKEDEANTGRNLALGIHKGSTGKGSTSNKSTLRSKRPGTTQQNPASKKAKTNRPSNTIERFLK
ncbi:DNA polymerase kappa isoform X2 [Rana temporaria]|uniref:DNA polymerase kappa isoform X2 n=1 Tax=Rana temporaria TaxID=8407 RepID=UPI001AACA59F|nr:DNA polymerase kappa isoform X2 [Rana temporaria]